MLKCNQCGFEGKRIDFNVANSAHCDLKCPECNAIDIDIIDGPKDKKKIHPGKQFGKENPVLEKRMIDNLCDSCTKDGGNCLYDPPGKTSSCAGYHKEFPNNILYDSPPEAESLSKCMEGVKNCPKCSAKMCYLIMAHYDKDGNPKWERGSHKVDGEDCLENQLTQANAKIQEQRDELKTKHEACSLLAKYNMELEAKAREIDLLFVKVSEDRFQWLRKRSCTVGLSSNNQRELLDGYEERYQHYKKLGAK